MNRRLFLAGCLMVLVIAAGGCQWATPAAPTPTMPVPKTILSKTIVKEVIGVGRDLRGALMIDAAPIGECVRVNGQALAWSPSLQVDVEGETLRVLRKWNGQVSVLRTGDEVLVMGSVVYKGEGLDAIWVTPSVEETDAQTGCKSGPYFVVGNIREIRPPTPPLSSP